MRITLFLFLFASIALAGNPPAAVVQQAPCTNCIQQQQTTQQYIPGAAYDLGSEISTEVHHVPLQVTTRVERSAELGSFQIAATAPPATAVQVMAPTGNTAVCTQGTACVVAAAPTPPRILARLRTLFSRRSLGRAAR